MEYARYSYGFNIQWPDRSQARLKRNIYYAQENLSEHVYRAEEFAQFAGSSSTGSLLSKISRRNVPRARSTARNTRIART